MKVLHIISDENIGGAGILLLNLLFEMDRNRIDSVVAVPKNGLLRERIESMGIPTVGLRYPCDRISKRSVREICGVIQSVDASLIHANAALSSRVAGRMCRIPVVHTRHCCFPPRGIWQLPPVRFVGGICNRMLSDRVIATAEAAAENLRSLGIPNDRIEVIINGSRPIREVSAEELASIRARYKIKDADFTVGICARLEPYKGHGTFLRAAKILCACAPQIPFRFLIVGDGSERASLEEMTRKLGISERVVFAGFVSDMAPIYRLLRINVNCSSGTETSCLALSEGMSAGVPCVVSNYGGNRAMIGEGDAGMLFPVGDAAALAECILQIAESPEKEVQMRRAALLRYEQKYTAKRMADEVASFYERMVKR